MALDAAAFSTHMATFIAAIGGESAFTRIYARQVNALKLQEFPALAYWALGAGIDGERSSDDERGQEVRYEFLVAAKLGDSEAQDVELGKLLKVIRDVAGALVTAGVDFEIGDWETDSNAEVDDGSVVWANFPVTMRFRRPRGDY